MHETPAQRSWARHPAFSVRDHLDDCEIGVAFNPKGSRLPSPIRPRACHSAERPRSHRKNRSLTGTCWILVWINELVLPFLMSRKFECHICQHFVRIHIGRRASSTMVPIHEKLVVILAFEAPPGQPCRWQLISPVSSRRHRCWLFQPPTSRPRLYKSGVVIDVDSGNLKVLKCPRSCAHRSRHLQESPSGREDPFRLSRFLELLSMQ